MYNPLTGHLNDGNTSISWRTVSIYKNSNIWKNKLCIKKRYEKCSK